MQSQRPNSNGLGQHVRLALLWSVSVESSLFKAVEHLSWLSVEGANFIWKI